MRLPGKGLQLMKVKKRIGILTGGGDCPALNAVIRASVKSALNRGWEVLGIKNSFEGFFNPGLIKKITADNIRISEKGGVEIEFTGVPEIRDYSKLINDFRKLQTDIYLSDKFWERAGFRFKVRAMQK